MTQSIKKGDSVTWNSQQGSIKGKVVKKVVKDETVKVGENKKRRVKASNENPQVIVKSNKTGKQAVHKVESVKKQ
ncbi:DUF2945 domain-containing protein [Candidatus Protochlamydia amoebophila]|uniref:Hypervirulence associated protein TUDOR domain-containing protein n=2 Tax=Candidatus Protochlamydia amoebophila TaxID=362787 RepID=A0A2P9HAI7_PARUW|nr:DUF2945 domain-containing protein [Candidatus Protochlamydia amoebophila]KIC72002.1 Uncharacterized protein DB44_CS00040 [Candidatus Protochlamydia amoebophila]SPJ31747.1 unnamed protein product [Candidatus Protochlamydia amoebophila UWE25]